MFARKVFRHHIIKEQGFVHSNMENEARVLEKFRENGGHENIVTVLGYGWLDPRKERFYVDLEPCIMNLDDYVKGNIKSMLGLEKYFDPVLHERSLRCLTFWGIMKDISSGLNFMHSSHELHRDVKPRNGKASHFLPDELLVLLSQRAAWKITDFDFTMTGGSKLAYSTNSAHGTDCYRAPELVKGTDPIVTMKSDIWALGCIMHELLTGLKAFPNDWNAWRYYSDNSLGLGDPPLPTFLSAQSDKCIRMLLNQVLTREWWKRPSAAEILELLNSVATGD